jgi:hypothetical protein
MPKCSCSDSSTSSDDSSEDENCSCQRRRPRQRCHKQPKNICKRCDKPKKSQQPNQCEKHKKQEPCKEICKKTDDVPKDDMKNSSGCIFITIR